MCVVRSTSVTSGITHRVLLLGPDDDARRALHLMLDRVGTQVAAVNEIAGARRYLESNDCDAVIAPSDVATAFADEGVRPALVAVIRPRDLSTAVSLFDAGID